MAIGRSRWRIPYGCLPSPNRLQAAYYFNGDGKSDIFWLYRTGENVVWLMDGTNVTTAASLPTVPTDWNLFTSPDFNGDGITEILSDFNGDARTDIFWRNNVTGENAAWLMDGTNIATAAFLPTLA